MFRQRLSLALAFLALAFLLQGALAWWAIESATDQVMRGRVASDLLQGHLQLSATKQRLRSWTLQALLQPGSDVADRDTHLLTMRRTLDRLDALAQQAAELDAEPRRAHEQLRQRVASLQILRHSLGELEEAVLQIRPLPQDSDRSATWRAINRVFEASQGQDLRQLVARTIAQEQAAVDRERAAADRTLYWLAGGVLTATITIALLAAALALYFAKALRRPLQALSAGARALQRGDLSHRMAEAGADEFADVARTLNAMARELQQHRERETQARHDLEQQVQARTAELVQALQRLEHNDASRRRLFADISHELRTPTTAIRGEAEIALRGRAKPVEAYQEALHRIVETAGQLGRVIDDLLTMARSDEQALSIQPGWVAASVPVQEALQQAQPLARERGQQIDAALDLPASCLIWADGPRLRQLVMLLLDNAIRYSHEGAVVRLRLAREGACWELWVQDEGIGIPADELPRVFERNFRGEQARRHRADGAGLGLPLAQALTHAHGGTLAIESTPGRGTQVRLRLPLQPREEALT